jgi:hypothetical protein
VKIRNFESGGGVTMKRNQPRCGSRALCAIVTGVTLLIGNSQQSASQASSKDAAAAEAAATAFLKAVQMADWKAAAGFIDIAPFDHYRLSQIDAARRMRRPSPLTVEVLMKMDSLMPRAVAEYEIKRMKERGQFHSFLEREFGVSDPDSLSAMPVSVVVAQWLEIHDPRWRFRSAIQERKLLAKYHGQFAGTEASGLWNGGERQYGVRPLRPRRPAAARSGRGAFDGTGNGHLAASSGHVVGTPATHPEQF